MKPFMDFSNYPPNHKLYNNDNKAKLGFFKDEFCGSKKCIEFIGLRAKCYCFNLEDKVTKELTSKKVCKGLGRVAITNRLKFQQYKKCLFEGKIRRHDFASIRSTKHKLSTIRQRKKPCLISIANVFCLFVGFTVYHTVTIKSKSFSILAHFVNNKNCYYYIILLSRKINFVIKHVFC